MQSRGVIPLEVEVGGERFIVPLGWVLNGNAVSFLVDNFSAQIEVDEGGSIRSIGGDPCKIELSERRQPVESEDICSAVCDPRLLPIVFQVVKKSFDLTRDQYFSAIEAGLNLKEGTIANNPDLADEISQIVESAKKSVRGA